MAMRLPLLVVALAVAMAVAGRAAIERRVSVSGLSAGAFAAVQYEVAFSAEVSGSVSFSGGPFFCAQGSLNTALMQCMNALPEPDAKLLAERAHAMAARGDIDALAHMSAHRSYVWAGTLDTTVKPKATQTLATQYVHLGMNESAVATDFDMPAQHAVPTASFGNACAYLGTPWVNNCGVDVARIGLDHVRNVPAAAAKNASAQQRRADVPSEDDLHPLNVDALVPDHRTPAQLSLDSRWFVYVPPACQNAECELHMSLHGCKQVVANIGFTYMLHTGVAQYALDNKLIVLFPQAIAGSGNPNYCFDWWGYVDDTYATRAAPQMVTMRNALHLLANVPRRRAALHA